MHFSLAGATSACHEEFLAWQWEYPLDRGTSAWPGDGILARGISAWESDLFGPENFSLA
jgi:hypothetical protein